MTRSDQPPVPNIEAELEQEADRLLRESGSLRSHGIVLRPDKLSARHDVRVSEEELEHLAHLPRDRRSTRQTQSKMEDE